MSDTPMGFKYPTQPEPPCPKCGHPTGFLMSDPQYRGPSSNWPPSSGREYLEWDCGHCGFTVQTPVADQK